jgi:polyhydroxybutyrate depolymerase
MPGRHRHSNLAAPDLANVAARSSLFVLVTLVVAALASGCGGRLKSHPEVATQSQQTTTSVEAPAPDQSADVAAAQVEASPPAGPLQASAAGSSGCGVARQNGKTVVETLTSDGVKRSYRLYVPKSYDPSKPAPLVLNFHGYGSNALEQESYSGFKPIADKAGFVLATPDGTNMPRRWYIYGKFEQGYVDDFAFTNNLIDHLEATLCIDASRVYATGISNGAGMSSLLGCRLHDRIAAIAPVAGSPYSDLYCRNQGPMPVIAFHGTDDQLVPFDGGPSGRLGLPAAPVRQNMHDWAQHNGCDMTLHSQRIASDVVLESYTNCNHGADVELYVIEGGGHTWPGASRDVPGLGKTTHSISASELIWAFFAAHPKP